MACLKYHTISLRNKLFSYTRTEFQKNVPSLPPPPPTHTQTMTCPLLPAQTCVYHTQKCLGLSTNVMITIFFWNPLS